MKVWYDRGLGWNAAPLESAADHTEIPTAGEIKLKIEGITASDAVGDAAIQAVATLPAVMGDPGPRVVKTDRAKLTVVQAVVHPIDSDFREGFAGRVMIGTRADMALEQQRYYTTTKTSLEDKPAQTEDGLINATVHFPGIAPEALEGRSVYLRFRDPPNGSPYDAQDVPNLVFPNEPSVQAGLTPAKVKVVVKEIDGQQIAAAERAFRVGRYAGNNWYVEASLTEDFKTVLGTSAMLVGWKRFYLEYDQMYKKGAYVSAAFTPDADGDADVISVLSTADVAVNSDVVLFSPTGSVTRTVQAMTADSITIADIDLPLEKFDGMRPANNSDCFQLTNLSDLGTTYGGYLDGQHQGDTRTADGGAFVEFVPSVAGSGAIPYFTGSQVETIGLANHWFAHRNNDDRTFQLIAAEAAGYEVNSPIGTIAPGGHAIDHTALVFVGGPIRRHTPSHEFGHLLGLSNAYPWVDQLAATPLGHDELGIDIMSYSSDPDYLELSKDSLYVIKEGA